MYVMRLEVEAFIDIKNLVDYITTNLVFKFDK